MKLKFKNQEFQEAATAAVCDVFDGQPYHDPKINVYTVDPGRVVASSQLSVVSSEASLPGFETLQQATLELPDDPPDVGYKNAEIELPLDVKDCPLSLPIPATKGVVDQAPVHAREILKHAISWGAKSIIVAHNHPTGDPTPSEEDIAVTAQLKSAAEIVSIPLKAHLVLGKDRYYVL